MKTRSAAGVRRRPRTSRAPAPSEALARELPGWVSGALVVGMLGALVWLERKRPLRRTTEPTGRRAGRNLAMAAINAVTLQALEKPVTTRLSALVHRRRWGLVKQLDLPPWLELPLTVVLLDYTLYLWHRLTHHVPLLWRLHQVHHSDRDLDATTALRFHFAEMALSVPWRAGQILVIGASPLALSTWQTLTLLAILFHHSNVALPARTERRLGRWIVTPRMHGTHHSVRAEETDSNWSTILSFPDFLHGTWRDSRPDDEIEIGAPGPREAGELTVGRMLRLPVRSGVVG